MPYTVYTTVNRSNGTDYEMDRRDFVNHEELVKGIDATIVDATAHCVSVSTMPPSSIIITVVPHF